MNLGKAEKPNVDEILNRRRQIEVKFKIRENPHKENSIIDNMGDDDSDRFIKIRNLDDDQSDHNGGLKLIPIPEEDDSFETYAVEEDLVPRTGPKKGKNNKRNKKHHKKPPRLSKADVGNLKGIEEEYWKSGARERARKMAAVYGEEGLEQAFSAKEMEKIQNWDFQAQKLDEA